MKSFSFLIFVVLAFCCWGTYGPTLHLGQAALGADGQLSSLRPFICVGIAYFLIAVLVPVLILMLKGEKGNWSIPGIVWSFLAGSVGAIGALGITMAFKFHGKPVYVMPLVFGCAPIVNTFVTMAMARTFRQATALFYLGIVIVAIGAAGVLVYKPLAPAHANLESPAGGAKGGAKTTLRETEGHRLVSYSQSDESATNGESATESETKNDSAAGGAAPPTLDTSLATRASNSIWIAISILVTALCWGAYGPVLHKGQSKMDGSRLRPFLCVGLAYFAIAVVVPYFLLPVFPEPGGWNFPGVAWSMAGGAVGAIGALGIIYAFNFGGKPIFVMPLVFGFAPVVNTLVETSSKGLIGQIQPLFIASLLMVIVGAVIVLVFAPRAPAPAPIANPTPL